MPFEAVQAAKSNPGQSKAIQTDQQKQPKADRSSPNRPNKATQSSPEQAKTTQSSSKIKRAPTSIVTAFLQAFLRVPKRVYRKLLAFLKVPNQPLK